MDCTSKPETDFRWERKPHPMCIPHIVDSILAYLSVADLKTCRLVSSQYNEIACKALQREETIIFRTIPQLETYLSNIKPISSSLPHHHHHHLSEPITKSSNKVTSFECFDQLSQCSSVEDYIEFEGEEEEERVLSQNESEDEDEDWTCISNRRDDGVLDTNAHMDCLEHLYPYSHRSFHFDYCDPKTELEEIDHFFRSFGAQIRRLKYTTDLLPFTFPQSLSHMGEVWEDRLCNLDELVLEMKWGIPAHLFEHTDESHRHPRVILPSLRKLHLDVLLTDRDADRAELFLRQLLLVTPNIEEISIPGSKRFFDDYINVVLARIIISTELPRLSTLNFCLALSDAQMRSLTDRNLPLSTLILDLEDVQFDDGGLGGDGQDFNDFQGELMEQDNLDDVQQQLLDNNNHNEEELRHHEFLRQNANRRPSFTPIVKSTLQRFLSKLAPTLSSLHICFPQSPRHRLHRFTILQEMTELKFLALGYFAGSSRILDQMPALKKLELWNVQFRDCHGPAGKVVPDKYQGITSVIS